MNTAPAVDSVRLSGDTAVITPVLAGNATAIDAISGAPVALNEIDPDSMSVDPQGDVVLVNQAGSELVFIGHPGTAAQTVRRLTVGTQLEDTIWARKTAGSLFVVDSARNATYVVRADAFVPGTAYTIAPSDSGVASFLGTVDLTTGIISRCYSASRAPLACSSSRTNANELGTSTRDAKLRLVLKNRLVPLTRASRTIRLRGIR